MATSLFVGNISFHATDADLRELFQEAGEVKTVRIIFDRSTGRSRGFGFVEMATNEQAERAVETFDGRIYRDRRLIVERARPQAQPSSGHANQDTESAEGDRRDGGVAA